jgi:hexosaminidase
MAKILTACALSALFLAPAAVGQTRTSVEWSTAGHMGDSIKNVHYVQRFVVKGDIDFKYLCFNQFARQMSTVNPSDTIVEIVPGYYRIASSRFGTPADSLVIEIDTRGRLVNRCYAPDGVHRVNADGATEAVTFTKPETNDPTIWRAAGRDPFIYGPDIYDFNASLKTDWTPGVYDVIPSYKKVKLTGGTSTVNLPEFKDINPENPDYYKITIKKNKFIVECRPDRQWAVLYPFYAKVIDPQREIQGSQGAVKLPNVVIENWPDYEWRGLMIDVARNFLTPGTMKLVLELMAANHLNRLHFHMVDDEAWRLEIKGLPELTEVGSRRGYTTDEKDHLAQIFCGDGNPDSQTMSNGYFSREDFIALIRSAHVLGIDVIPEIESPGHARAAIKAMEKRHRAGDDTYRLIHDNDSSTYTSAQWFHDNVMNPALPGPYKFMEKVFDEVIAMYDEAGVPLRAIHIGGDEVPRGAWNGSSVAQDFMKAHSMTTEKELHAYFVSRLAEILSKKGVKMNGWQEIAVGHSDDYNRQVSPSVGGVNCWSTLGKEGSQVARRAVQAGFNVILSNVDKFYFDLSYSSHPEEKGLTWGGSVDEFSALSGYGPRLCPTDETTPGHVLGVNAQLFGETMRSQTQPVSYIVPKIFGLAERAWNSTETYSKAQFNTIIGDKELPYLTGGERRLNVHMRQPGIKIIDGLAHMNSPYSGGVIRYTTDGSEPTATSTAYDKPFPAAENADIRARLFRDNAVSVTTYLSPVTTTPR